MTRKATLDARRRPKQARARHTEEAILRAAAQILVQEGYDRASTNRIALRAGVSIGSLYQYYPSKEALVSALIDRHVEEIQQLLLDSVSAMADAPLEHAVRTYVRAMLRAHAVDPKLHQVFFEQIPKLGGFARAKDITDRSMIIVRAYLERHRHRLRPMDLDLAVFTLVYAVEGVTHAAVLTRPASLDKDELAEEISQLILSYLLQPAAPAATVR